MKNKLRLLVTLTLFLSFGFSGCNEESIENSIKQNDGTVWISGGLAVCAMQIHLDNGDTLIVNLGDIGSFRSDDRVNVRYREIGKNEFCSACIDCEIIKIKKIK